jgi:hypothetical protein
MWGKVVDEPTDDTYSIEKRMLITTWRQAFHT